LYKQNRESIKRDSSILGELESTALELKKTISNKEIDSIQRDSNMESTILIKEAETKQRENLEHTKINAYISLNAQKLKDESIQLDNVNNKVDIHRTIFAEKTLKNTLRIDVEKEAVKREIRDFNDTMNETIGETEKELLSNISSLSDDTRNRFLIVEKNISQINETIKSNKEKFDLFYSQVNEAIEAINSNFKELKDNIQVVDEKAISNYEALSRIDIDLQEVKTIQLKQEKRDIGTLVWAYECDDSIGLYEMDGSKYQDEKLADFLFLKDLQGFSMDGDVIDTPNLKGRFIGYSGALGIGSVGTTGADKTAVNGLNIQIGIDKDTGDGDNYKYWAVGGVAHPRYGFTTMDNYFYKGDTETLPNWYALKLCVKGKY